MRTIYINRHGFVRLQNTEEGCISLQVTQSQYENVLNQALFIETCITPISNFETYKDGDELKTEDIPEEAEFIETTGDESDIEKSEKMFNIYIAGLLERIENDSIEDYNKHQIYIDGEVCTYTDKDRMDLNILVSNNKGGFYNGKAYDAEDLKALFYSLENELCRLQYYKSVLIELTNQITYEQFKNDDFEETVWGMYNDVIEEKMNEFEEPFK